jgi:hypothetical protein
VCIIASSFTTPQDISLAVISEQVLLESTLLERPAFASIEAASPLVLIGVVENLVKLEVRLFCIGL